MILHHPKSKPEPLRLQRSKHPHPGLAPFLAFEWLLQWLVYMLSNWSFLELLEYLGSFSVLIGVIFYFSESGDRLKQKHYQAWQVINTAQGKGGNGGRIDALQELNADNVSLVGVDASGASLQGIRLGKADLSRANLNSADLRNSDFEQANLAYADLHFANFRQGNLRRTLFQEADLSDADLSGADLTSADLTDANLSSADLRGSDLKNTQWTEIKSIDKAEIGGIKNAPAGFREWALLHGAKESAALQNK
jgi:hypothetical protein